jgi:hypothetical protein
VRHTLLSNKMNAPVKYVKLCYVQNRKNFLLETSLSKSGRCGCCGNSQADE